MPQYTLPVTGVVEVGLATVKLATVKAEAVNGVFNELQAWAAVMAYLSFPTGMLPTVQVMAVAALLFTCEPMDLLPVLVTVVVVSPVPVSVFGDSDP
jgi:hypothetical protein